MDKIFTAMLVVLTSLVTIGCPYDEDGDGSLLCHPDLPTPCDCDDKNAAVFPGATEIPGDGIDQDCDGVDGIDADGDGVAPVSAGGRDCDDTDATVYPGAVELCDDKDNDCNGTVDDTPVLMRDRFSGSTHWGWTQSSGRWSVRGGQLEGIGDGGSTDAWLYSNGGFSGDIQLEADVHFVTGNAELVLNSTGHWFNEYRIEIWSNQSSAYTNKYQVSRYKNGRGVGLTAGNVASPVQITNPSRVKVRRVGNRLTVVINGTPIKTIVDTNPLPARGKVGLGVVWNWTGRFDNVVVRSCTAKTTAIAR